MQAQAKIYIYIIMNKLTTGIKLKDTMSIVRFIFPYLKIAFHEFNRS